MTATPHELMQQVLVAMSTHSVAMVLTGSLCASVILIVASLARITQDSPKKPKIKNLRKRLLSHHSHGILCESYEFKSSLKSCLPTNISSPKSFESTQHCISRPSPIHLDLSLLQLPSCPDRLGFLGAQLRSLNLSCNQLLDVPPEIGCLRGLRTLDLHGNQLSTLPMSLCHLKQLHHLDVSHNRFTCVPACVPLLHELRQLRVNDNFITALPSSICQLHHLHQLWACHNQLKLLPKEICLMINLQLLHVSFNQIRDLPRHLGSLKHLCSLDASSNCLLSLPSSIVWCSRLQSLTVANNGLVKLPEKLGHLCDLVVLNVHSNCLKYLPKSIMNSNVNHINASDNALITEISDSESSVTETPMNTSPTLLELSLLTVIEHGVQWQAEELPKELHELLHSVKYCGSCDVPIIRWAAVSLEFLDKLPFCQFFCAAHKELNTDLLYSL